MGQRSVGQCCALRWSPRRVRWRRFRRRKSFRQRRLSLNGQKIVEMEKIREKPEKFPSKISNSTWSVGILCSRSGQRGEGSRRAKSRHLRGQSGAAFKKRKISYINPQASGFWRSEMQKILLPFPFTACSSGVCCWTPPPPPAPPASTVDGLADGLNSSSESAPAPCLPSLRWRVWKMLV